MDSIENEYAYDNSDYVHGTSDNTKVIGQTCSILLLIGSVLMAILVLACRASVVFWGYKNCCDTAEESQETTTSPVDSEQYPSDRVLAEALQRHIDKIELGRQLAVQRKERRMWYEYSTKPWTMTVKQSDLFYGHRKDSPSSENVKEDGTLTVQTIWTTQQQISKSGDKEIEEVEAGNSRLLSSQFIVCDKDEDETAELYLKLKSSGRCVDGNCAFCMEDYEEGCQVIYSDNLHCSHAFHKDCLMQWLSKGKKRCPVCRHWFVPGTKIDEQKAAHGDVWCRALSRMEQREEDEREQQQATQESTETISEIEPQTVETETDTETQRVNDSEQGIAEAANTTLRSTSEQDHTKLLGQ